MELELENLNNLLSNIQRERVSIDKLSSDTHDEILAKVDDAQQQSALLSLPNEIFMVIYEFVLTTDYDEFESEPYTRPQDEEHDARTREDNNSFLRCCRTVYRRCWWAAMVLPERAYWITHAWFRKHSYSKNMYADWVLPLAKKRMEVDRVQIRKMHLFTELGFIDTGECLDEILSNPLLHSDIVVVALRPGDWLEIPGDEIHYEGFQNLVSHLSPITREFHIELGCEHLDIRDINTVARKMKKSWFFIHPNGCAMLPDASKHSTHSWTEVNKSLDMTPWHNNWRSEPKNYSFYRSTIVFCMQDKPDPKKVMLDEAEMCGLDIEVQGEDDTDEEDDDDNNKKEEGEQDESNDKYHEEEGDKSEDDYEEDSDN